MTRNRINIDVDATLNGWLTGCADALGCSKTETARAVLHYTLRNHLTDPYSLEQIIKEHRRAANRARGQRRTDRHQAPPGSGQ